MKTMLLLCALVVGSSAWGVETLYSTCLFGNGYGTSNNYDSTWDTTNGTFSWSVSNGNTNGTNWAYAKFGRKNTASTGTVTTKTAYSVALTKVAVTIDALTSAKINSIKLYTSSNGTSWSEAGTFTKGTGTKSVTLASPTANLYYKVEFDCASGSSNGLIQVSKIDYYYDVASSATLDHIVLGGTYPTEFYVGDAFSYDGLTVTAHYDDLTTANVTTSATVSDPDMSSAGVKTITVTYEENSVVKTATYDINVSPVPPVVLTLDFATNILGLPVGSKDKETESTGYSYGGYTYTLAAPDGFYYLEATTPSTYKCLLMGKNGATLTFPAFPFKVKMIKVYGTSGASGSVKQNIFVGDDAISTETTGAKDVTNVYIIPSAYQAIGTVYVLKVTSSANTQISKIEILGDGEEVEVSAAGLATFASDNKLDFTNVPDLEAYIAKEAAGVITLKQVNKVDAGTGVLLRALNGTTAFGVPVTTADADDATGNMFVRGNDAAVATSEGGNYNWILSKKGEVIGFYHANGNTVAKNRAYLQTSTASARISLDFDDNETTGLSEVTNTNLTNNTNEFFDLQGRKVAQPTKGLYIVNGKKVVIK